MVIPKSTAGKLRENSHSLQESLTQISLVVEELSTHASEINNIESVLYGGLHKINCTSMK